ncbi:YdaU family protein [Ochrobactrum sp. WV_118_8]|uniref:YdaU family protein n=1 Tax=Brucella anthropi TaxID=529 RepID=UPI00215767F5|nr:YdaU family protein [Brucella anthropi]MCR8492778.1 YdaU family protein [Brucella anthropi]
MSRDRIPYFDFYPSDFMHGVRGLSAQEVGVYTMMLCRIYEENGPVEFHVMRLSTYCGMRENTFVKTVEKLIELGKLQLIDGMITNHRAEAEISSRANKLKNNSKAGKASAEKRQQKQRSNSTDVQQTFNHTDTDTDITSSLRSDVSIKPDFDSEFEQQFWPIYPRRVGKGQALKAFRSARKQAELETILAGVRRYADDRQGESPEFTKHASTWLNGQCWLDETVPKRAAPPPKQSSRANPRQQMWIDEFNKHSGQSHEPVSEEGSVLDLSHGDGYSRSDGGSVRLAYSRLG